MALPTNGDELYETVIEPLMTPLNAGRRSAPPVASPSTMP